LVRVNDKRTSILPLFGRLADDGLALIRRCQAARREYVAPALGRMQCRLENVFNTLQRPGARSSVRRCWPLSNLQSRAADAAVLGVFLMPFEAAGDGRGDPTVGASPAISAAGSAGRGLHGILRTRFLHAAGFKTGKSTRGAIT